MYQVLYIDFPQSLKVNRKYTFNLSFWFEDLIPQRFQGGCLNWAGVPSWSLSEVMKCASSSLSLFFLWSIFFSHTWSRGTWLSYTRPPSQPPLGKWTQELTWLKHWEDLGFSDKTKTIHKQEHTLNLSAKSTISKISQISSAPRSVGNLPYK